MDPVGGIGAWSSRPLPPGMRVRTGHFDGFSWQVWGLPVVPASRSDAPAVRFARFDQLHAKTIPGARNKKAG
jgi:hypothetical protein